MDITVHVQLSQSILSSHWNLWPFHQSVFFINLLGVPVLRCLPAPTSNVGMNRNGSVCFFSFNPVISHHLSGLPRQTLSTVSTFQHGDDRKPFWMFLFLSFLCVFRRHEIEPAPLVLPHPAPSVWTCLVLNAEGFKDRIKEPYIFIFAHISHMTSHFYSFIYWFHDFF